MRISLAVHFLCTERQKHHTNNIELHVYSIKATQYVVKWDICAIKIDCYRMMTAQSRKTFVFLVMILWWLRLQLLCLSPFQNFTREAENWFAEDFSLTPHLKNISKNAEKADEHSSKFYFWYLWLFFILLTKKRLNQSGLTITERHQRNYLLRIFPAVDFSTQFICRIWRQKSASRIALRTVYWQVGCILSTRQNVINDNWHDAYVEFHVECIGDVAFICRRTFAVWSCGHLLDSICASRLDGIH